MTTVFNVITWLDLLVMKHKFRKKGGGYSSSNNNYNCTLREPVTVKMQDGKVFMFPADVQVTVFRPYDAHGSDVIATVFMSDRQVRIRAGGIASVHIHDTNRILV